jgi:uncharacterized protein YhaN
MAGLDDVTLGELARNLTAAETRINGKFADLKAELNQNNRQLSDRFDQLEYVHRDTYRAEASAMEQRIEVLEERSRWVTRALAGIPFAAAGAAIAAAIVSTM